MCASVGITGSVSIRPYLELTDAEKSHARWAIGRMVIQSSGMHVRAPITNKQWYPERFQAVVDALHEEADSSSSVLAKIRHSRVSDLRGATTFRESAAILHHTRLYVGTVGFLMHLAKAVECPSVIVFGGREAPWQSGYICNFNPNLRDPVRPVRALEFLRLRSQMHERHLGG